MKKQKLSSLQKYFELEKAIISDAQDEKAQEWIPRRGEINFTIPENLGNIQLFNVIDASKCFKKMLNKGSSENKAYVEKILEDLRKNGNRRKFSTAPTLAQLDELAENFPNFTSAIEFIKGAVALSNLSNINSFQLSPLLLNGPPGIGKTAFVQALSALTSNNFCRIDIGTITTGSEIMGLSLNWATGETGEIFNTLTSSDFINPIMMLDELDKIETGQKFPIEPALLSLLEKESARKFRDEAIPLEIDASYITWIATCNQLGRISDPLLSRFNVVEVHQPNEDQMRRVVNRMYQKVLARNSWGNKFEDSLKEHVIEKLLTLPPRRVERMLHHMLGKAALENRDHLSDKDVITSKNLQKAKIGFY